MKGIELLFLGLGGVLGTLIRYKITSSPIIFNTLPLNVLIVNIVGSFILGIFVVASNQWNLEGKYFLFVAVGFCGSLTTMSAFALDSVNLLENSQFVSLAIIILANVGLSIGSLFAGKTVMNLLVN